VPSKTAQTAALSADEIVTADEIVPADDVVENVELVESADDVTDESADDDDDELSPEMQQIETSLDALFASITAASKSAKLDTSEIDAKLTHARAFADDDSFRALIAALEVKRETAIRDHVETAQRAVITEATARFGGRIERLAALFQINVKNSTSGTSRSNGTSKSTGSERTVIRDIVDVTAASEYIGADLDEIAALGHECRLTSILRNGAKSSANLKQQTAIMREIDATAHAKCIALADKTRLSFRKRADIRNA
jgi:hypothetical protein